MVHTESDDADFSPNLGTLFDVWGLRLSDECIGAYCAEGDKELRVFVDGEEVTGDPREVALTDLSVIVVTYGTEEQLPDPIPSEFVPASRLRAWRRSGRGSDRARDPAPGTRAAPTWRAANARRRRAPRARPSASDRPGGRPRAA